MHRKLLLLTALTFGLATGCCMCDAPYDYCGPLFQGGPYDDCAPDARMNSVFMPYAGPYGDGHVEEGAVPHSIVQPPEQVSTPDPAPPSSEMETAPEQPTVPRQLAPNMTRDPRFRSISERSEQQR